MRLPSRFGMLLGVLLVFGLTALLGCSQSKMSQEMREQESEMTEESRRWADEILAVSPMSVRASKQAVYRGLEEGGVAGAESVRYPAVAAMVASEDYIEGPRAFAEKRPPNWKGR